MTRLTQPQLYRANELAIHRVQAQSMETWADKQPAAKDFTIEVTRQGAPIRMVVSGVELYELARAVKERITQELKRYDIEIDDGDEKQQRDV